MGPWLYPYKTLGEHNHTEIQSILLVGVTQVRWGKGVHTNHFHR